MEDGVESNRNDEDPALPAGAASTPVRPDRQAGPRGERPPAPGSWVGIVANRGSGSGSGLHLVNQLAAELEARGIGVRIAWSPRDRRELAAASADDPECRCLVAAGGDGTVAALLNEKPRPPIAILPAGTENLTAAHFRHRRNPRALAETIAAGASRTVDLGAADGRRFMLMAGFGFDGDVVTRHHQGRLGAAGRVRPTTRAAYVEPILKSSFFYKFPRIHVRIDDPPESEPLTGTTVFLFNLPRYALGLPFVPEARDDDGRLDLLVFKNPGPFQALYYLARVLCRSHLRDPGVTHRRVRRVTLTAEQAVPIQLDGDPAGRLDPDVLAAAPMVDESSDDPTASPSIRRAACVVEVLPGAVQVLTPARPRPSIPHPLALAKDRRSR